MRLGRWLLVSLCFGPTAVSSVSVEVTIQCVVASGQPAPGVFLRWSVDGETVTGLTDVTGLAHLRVRPGAQGVLLADRYPYVVTRVLVNDRAVQSNVISIDQPTRVQIEMMPGGSMEGMVTLGGRPYGGARVRLEPVTAYVQALHPVDAGEPPLSVVTDSRGGYRIGGLQARAYVVAVEPSPQAVASPVTLPGNTVAPGHSPTQRSHPVPTYFPLTSSSAEAEPVSVVPGRAVRIDLQLLSASPAVLSGQVLDPSGARPFDQVLVSETAFDRLDRSRVHRTTRLDDRGRFIVEGLMPGRYRLLGRTIGSVPLFLDHFEEVTGDGESRMALRLFEGGHVQVRLEEADLAAPDSRRRADLLRLVRTGQWPLVDTFDVIRLAPSSRSGAILAAAVTPGRYRLEVDRAVAWNVPWTLTGLSGGQVFADVTEGGTVELQARWTAKALGVSGVIDAVAEHESKGVAIVSVDESWWYPGSPAIRLVPVGDDGAFAAPELPAGDYVALPIAVGTALASRSALAAIASSGQRFVATAGEWVEIRLQAGSSD